MRAVSVDKPVRAHLVLVEDEVLAHEPHGLGRAVVELGDGGDRHPVAPEQLAHGRVGADLRQGSVLLLAEHGAILPPEAQTHNVCYTSVVWPLAGLHSERRSSTRPRLWRRLPRT